MDYEKLARDLGGAPAETDYTAIAKELGGAPTEAPRKEGATQFALTTASGAMPYLTAAAAGGAVGALGGPFAPLTAPVGAALATGALGLSDMGVGIYNAFARERQPLPSETINQLYGKIGAYTPPETEEQRIGHAIGGGMASSYGMASAANQFAKMATSPLGQRVLSALGYNMPAQVVGGGMGGAGGQIAQEMGAGPLGTFAGSMLGGMLGGAAASAPKPGLAATRAISDPFLNPNRVAVNKATQNIDDLGAVRAALDTPETATTPGFGRLTTAERVLDVAGPEAARPLAALEQGLSQTSEASALSLSNRQTTRIQALQDQLDRIDADIARKANTLSPADRNAIDRTRADLVKQLSVEQEAAQAQAQGVAKTLPQESQMELGQTLQRQGEAGERALQTTTITPTYEAAFKGAEDPAIGMGSSLDMSRRLIGGLESVMTGRKVSEGMRKLFALDTPEPPTTQTKTAAGVDQEWSKFMPRAAKEEPQLSLRDFDTVRKALGKERRDAYDLASRGDSAAGARARNLDAIIAEMDSALERSPLPQENKDLYALAKSKYETEMVPRYGTGETAKMLAEGKFNMPRTLPDEQVGAFLKSQTAAEQFVTTFHNDRVALETMERGVLDKFREAAYDAPSRTINPKSAAKFEAEHKFQLDALENAGINVRERMAQVREDAAAAKANIDTLGNEAKKFAGKTAEDVVDLALKSPMDMKFVRERLSPEGLKALSGELAARATDAINDGNPAEALRYLKDNEKALKVGLGKERGKTYGDLVDLATRQQEAQGVRAQAPKQDARPTITLPDNLSQAELTDLKVVSRDIQRLYAMDDLKRPAAKNVSRMASEQAHERGMAPEEFPSLLDAKIAFAKSLLRRMADRINYRSNARLNQLLVDDPQAFAREIDNVISARTKEAMQPERPTKDRYGELPPAFYGASQEYIRNRMRPTENRNAMAR